MKNLSTQEYLSLGYLYLLIVGILTETIFYSFLGINILNYSTFLDILITPIKYMASNIILPAVLLLIGLLLFIWIKYVVPRIKMTDAEKLSASQANPVVMIAIMILFLFLGLGIGMGIKTSARMKEGNITPDHTITFTDSKQLNVRIIGQNSMYYFYIPENEKEIIASPIGNSIFQIKKLPK